MIAGLSTQVVTLVIFMLLALDFGLNTIRRVRLLGAQNALDPLHASLRKSVAFNAFLFALSLSTVLIFSRCVFRVAELKGGWHGKLMKNEGLFIGLEGVVIIIATLLLAVFHPSLCIEDGTTATAAPAQPNGQSWFKLKSRSGAKENSTTSLEDKESQAVGDA